jgi:GNAT superfamily N-acetyltransferase
VVDVAQLTQPVHRWFTRHRGHSADAAPPHVPVPEGVRIRRRKDNQVAAAARLLGIISSESGTGLYRTPSRRAWLTGEDLLEAWVAEQGLTIQGHVALSRIDGDATAALRWREVTGLAPGELAAVSRFFVRHTVRGRGIGSALLATALQEARARGLVAVADMVSTSRRGVPLFDRADWRLAAMFPSGQRGSGLQTYLYVAPPA